MLSWLRPLWYEVFPFWLQSNAERYGQEAASNPDFAANTTALQARIPDMGRNEVDLIHAYAKGRMDAEAARANSVLSRAQALLVAQAFLGALLSLGGTVVGHLEAFSFWRSSLLGIVALYLVIQTVLLTVSALRALSGVPFPAIGSSDLLAMLSSPADDIVRQMTLQMLLHYRTAANLNTWRFSHLSNAQTALRNTAIALAVLVVFTLALSVFAAPKPPAPGLVVKLPRSEIAVVGAGPSPLSDRAPNTGPD